MILEKNKLIVPNKDITYFLAPDYIYVPASKIYVKNNDYISPRALTIFQTIDAYAFGQTNIIRKQETKWLRKIRLY